MTTGASNDIERATDIARNMVTKWGLSEKMGPLAYSEDEGEIFLGRSVTQHKNLADDTARVIDEEIRDFIDRNYERAEKLLKDNEDILHTMSKALMKYETIDVNQINQLMERKEVTPPKDWDDEDSSSSGSNKTEDKTEEKKEDKGDGSIGGPASLH